ncbi:MAG: glycosyltransferase family 4 protein [Candidatus Zixiibacteriota bacterium]
MRKLCVLQLINVRWYNACAYYAVTLSRALKRRGHKVILAGDPDSPPVNVASRFGLETYDKLYLSRMNPFTFLYNIKKLSNLIDEKKIDVINAHRAETHLLAALCVKWFNKKIPVIRTRGDVRPPKNNMFSRYLNRNLTHKVITTAEILKKDYVRSLSLDEGKALKISPGVDNKYFTPQNPDSIWKRKLGIPDDCLVVGMVGRLSPVKGHRYFIKAADFVLRNFTGNVKFIIAGEDAQIKSYQLKQMTEQLKIRDKFSFTGKVDDIRKIVSLFDIGIVASTGSETICRVALEYMAMGKPVVGTNINAVPEVVKHKVNGLIVPSGDSKNLGEAILLLLRDEQLRKVFGKTSRKIVEDEFSLHRLGALTEEVYYQLMEKTN